MEKRQYITPPSLEELEGILPNTFSPNLEYEEVTDSFIEYIFSEK